MRLLPFYPWKRQKRETEIPSGGAVNEVEESVPPVIPEIPEVILPAPPQVKKSKPRPRHSKVFRLPTPFEMLKRAGTGEESWELFDEAQFRGRYGRYTIIKLRNKLTQEIHVELFKE